MPARPLGPAKFLTAFAAGLPPSCAAWPIAGFRLRIEPSQVASFGVTRPAATMPGSFSATTRCSLRRLETPSTITSTKIGTIQNT